MSKTNKSNTKKHSPCVLRLYVAGMTGRSVKALANLKAVCEELIPGKYDIEVVDLLTTPELATQDQIIATPTVVRRMSGIMKKLIGDLSDREKIIIGLDLRTLGGIRK